MFIRIDRIDERDRRRWRHKTILARSYVAGGKNKGLLHRSRQVLSWHRHAQQRDKRLSRHQLCRAVNAVPIAANHARDHPLAPRD